MMKLAHMVSVLLLGMALSACKNDKPTDQRNASGEILAGTISDSMLPTDSTKSHAPRAPENVATLAASDAASENSDTAAAASAASSEP